MILPRFLKRLHGLLVLSALTVISSSSINGADWMQWRGPHGNGSVEGGVYPVNLNAEQPLWKVALPGKGCSTPIVLDGRIYLTVPADGKDSVEAYGLDGKRLWQTSLGKENPGRHRNGSGSNPSPITDGKKLYVNYKSGALASLTLGGKVRWEINLVEMYGPDTLYWDHGTSPVLTKDHVVMARMHEGESWLAAFEKDSGKLAWKVARNYKTPREGDHGYATPQIIQHKGKEALLVWGTQHLTVHDPNDGAIIWSCGDFNPDEKALWPAVATPVVVGDMAVVPFGRNDRKIPRIHGIRLDGSGDVTETHRVWKRNDISSFVPSPAAHDGKVYLLRDRGEIECLDPKSGKTIWNAALPKNKSNYYSSPLIADGKLYAAREDGVVFVVGIENGYELLSENDMGESVIAMPVPYKNHLLIRSAKYLFCFKGK